MFSIFFLGALYQERVLGYTPLQIGLAFLPGSLLMGLFSLRYTERLVHRFGARPISSVDWCSSLGRAAPRPRAGRWSLLARPAADDDRLRRRRGPVVPGAGDDRHERGPAERGGLASGLVNTTAQVGGALGLAVLATVAAGRTDALTGAGRSLPEALTGGYHLAFLVGAGLLGTAIVVALVVLRPAAAAAGFGDPLPQESG